MSRLALVMKDPPAQGRLAGGRPAGADQPSVGVTTTALKQQKPTEDVAEVVEWMKRLNREAAKLGLAFGLRAATDITGFGFLGHAWEMAQSAGLGLQIQFDRMPLFPVRKSTPANGVSPEGHRITGFSLAIMWCLLTRSRRSFRCCFLTRRPAAACY